MQQEEEPSSTEVPWHRSLASVFVCARVFVCVCLCASASFCASPCAGYVHMLVLQHWNESHTHGVT